MKRILFAFFILFSSWSILAAQTDINVSKYTLLNKEEALEFAKESASLCKTKWVFFREKENGETDINRNLYFVTFLNSDELPKDKLDKLLEGTEKLENNDFTLQFQFRIRYIGSNEDLEIKGDKKYLFDNVYGKYLDIFPIWEKFFKPGAPLEGTLNEYKYTVSDDTKARYRLSRGGNKWSIKNSW